MAKESLDLERVQRFFQEHEGYKLEASHVDHPGKDLVTVYDTEQDMEKTLTWEGGDRYGIVKEDGIEPLPEDSDLYQTAHDIKDLYDSGLIVSDDGRVRAGTAALSKSGGESSYALNNPLEWGVEHDLRRWEDRERSSLIGKLLDSLP